MAAETGASIDLGSVSGPPLGSRVPLGKNLPKPLCTHFRTNQKTQTIELEQENHILCLPLSPLPQAPLMEQAQALPARGV